MFAVEKVNCYQEQIKEKFSTHAPSPGGTPVYIAKSKIMNVEMSLGAISIIFYVTFAFCSHVYI
jgi:hypothetical protein